MFPDNNKCRHFVSKLCGRQILTLKLRTIIYLTKTMAGDRILQQWVFQKFLFYFHPGGCPKPPRPRPAAIAPRPRPVFQKLFWTEEALTAIWKKRLKTWFFHKKSYLQHWRVFEHFRQNHELDLSPAEVNVWQLGNASVAISGSDIGHLIGWLENELKLGSPEDSCAPQPRPIYHGRPHRWTIHRWWCGPRPRVELSAVRNIQKTNQSFHSRQPKFLTEPLIGIPSDISRAFQNFVWIGSNLASKMNRTPLVLSRRQ